jgi:hypothetical protein
MKAAQSPACSGVIVEWSSRESPVKGKLTGQYQLRLVDHWYIHKGKWRWTLYIGSVVMMQGESPETSLHILPDILAGREPP